MEPAISGKAIRMPNIFADTAGWGHLVDTSQPYHSLAATIYRTARRERNDYESLH
jgi:hypothetical protein